MQKNLGRATNRTKVQAGPSKSPARDTKLFGVTTRAVRYQGVTPPGEVIYSATKCNEMRCDKYWAARAGSPPPLVAVPAALVKPLLVKPLLVAVRESYSRWRLPVIPVLHLVRLLI